MVDFFNAHSIYKNINNNIMVTRKDAAVIGSMLAFIGVFYGFSLLPDNSTAKNIYTIIFMILFGLALLWFTPLGNPIKNLITKLTNKNKPQ